ncbi:MAG TPA: type II secretion system protein [Desulfuromonadaceae bacterium]|nr:type II secretion system protein [Desulfuromonadaceae bacterium]
MQLHHKEAMTPLGHDKTGGFSLLELLLVMAIVAGLSAMFFEANAPARQRAQKLRCSDNLQKIFLALEIYRNDFGKFPVATNAPTSEVPLNLLVPRYSADTSIFICPGGRDGSIPSGASLLTHRISYAYYMGRDTNAAPRDVVMSDRQVNTLAKAPGGQVFSLDGKSPGNNHNKSGGNFLFCDGSVESSEPVTTLSLSLSNGVVLLNPKP